MGLMKTRLLFAFAIFLFAGAFVSASTLNVVQPNLSASASNIAEQLPGQNYFHLKTTTGTGTEARIGINLPSGTTLNKLDKISWSTNVTGYAPHVDVFLDLDSDGVYNSSVDDVLVFEYAKVDNSNCDDTPYPTGNLITFGTKGNLTNSSYGWLNSGDAGPCGGLTFYFHSLSDWKNGITANGKAINGTNKVLRLEVEIDNWIIESEAYMNNIAVNLNGINYYATIQSAIDSVVSGDTINVSAGNYNENILIQGKSNIIIKGASGTIISPSSGIGFAIGNSSNITIESLAINTSGTNAHGIWIGGAGNNYANSSNITINNNIINVAGVSTGIYAEQVNPPHNGWKISNNNITTPSGVPLELYDANSAEVSGNFLNGSTTNGNVFWSSELSNLSSLTFKDNTIINSVGSMVVIKADLFQLGDGLDNTFINNVVVSSNRFAGWDSRALRTGDRVTNFKANKNEFLLSSQTEIFRNDNSSESINASYNYWGTNSNATIFSLVSGNVTYSPWMNNPLNATPDALNVTINDSNGYTNSPLVNIILKALGELPDLFSLSLNNSAWTSWVEWGHGNSANYTINLTDFSIGGNSSDGNKTFYTKVASYLGNENSTHVSNSTILDTTLPSLNTTTISNAFSNGTNYVFSPNNDGNYENISVDVEYSESGSVKIYVENSSNFTIKELYSNSDVKNPSAKTWNGTYTNGTIVPNGVYFIRTNITDLAGNSNNSILIASVFVQNPKVSIASSTPSKTEIVVKLNDTSTLFSVSASDSENTSLNYNWYVNSISAQNGTNSSFVRNSSALGEFRILVNITDISSNYNSKGWNLTITEIPVTKVFTSSETTNLSQVSNISAVSNFKLASSGGKIDFSGGSLDLSDVLDLDSNVKIENGIVAINTSKYPQLNKSAKITITGLSYTSVPKILYNGGFTTNENDIALECDFCEIVNYTQYPTSNGNVTFTTEHFTSFAVGNSGEKYDISLFDDLDKCESGNTGNLSLEIDNPDEGDDFKIGETIDVKASVSNDAEKKKKVIVKASLYDIDRENVEENIKSDSNSISDGDSNTFKTEIKVPDDAREDNSFGIFVKAYEFSNEENECIQGFVGININRDEDDVVIKNAVLSTDTFYSGDIVDVFVDVQNMGSEDKENVYITLENPELDISEKSKLFDLEKFDDDDSASSIFSIRIPQDAKEGDYLLSVEVVFDGGSDEVVKTISVINPLSAKEGVIKLGYEKESSNTINLGSSPVTGKAASGVLKNDYSLAYVLMTGIAALVLLLVIALAKIKPQKSL